MENQREYSIHWLAHVFPPLTPERYAALVASIQAIGLIDPITVWQDQIIDGLHRLRACAEAGVEPRYEFLDDAADPVQYVLAKNGLRRDMDDSERAVVAHLLSQGSAPGRPRQDGENCSDVNSFTQGQAGEAWKVSRTMVSYAKRVLSEDGPAVPELRQAVKDWKVKVSPAAQLANRPPEVQQRALNLWEKKGSGTLTEAARQVERQMTEEADAAALDDYRARSLDETATLHVAPVSGLQALVAAGSVDAIITHPPHTEDFLPTFADLAAFAAHALKPTGVLVVVGHGMLLPRILKNLERPDLHWVVGMDLVFHGKPASSGRPRFMHLHRRPVLVFCKGMFRTDGMHDLFQVPPREELPGELDEGEMAMQLIVEQLVQPGQTICDPVMLDRAGTALAARRYGCIFIGAAEHAYGVVRVQRRLLEAEDNVEDNVQDQPEAGSPSEVGKDG